MCFGVLASYTSTPIATTVNYNLMLLTYYYHLWDCGEVLDRRVESGAKNIAELAEHRNGSYVASFLERIQSSQVKSVHRAAR